MKKFSFICLLAILIVSGCSRQKSVEITILGMGTDYYLFPETLNGKVKELHETNYWAVEKDGNITKGDPATWKELDSIGSTKSFVAYFDEAGLLTKYDNLDEDNVIRNSSIGTPENGKYVRWEFKLKDSVYLYLIPEYDSSGYFIGGNAYRPITDTLVNRQIISRDAKGNYTKIEYLNFKKQKGGYQVFILNDNGQVTETKFFNKYDTLRSTFTNTYNDKGYLVQQHVFIEKPKSTSTWVMKNLKFDDRGNWLEVFSNIDDGKYKLMAERSYIYY